LAAGGLVGVVPVAGGASAAAGAAATGACASSAGSTVSIWTCFSIVRSLATFF
jgi:hypothetical protein